MKEIFPLDIVKKIPRWEQIIPVYAVIVMMVYVWSLFQYFWRLSSWLNFSTLGQVGGIYVYTAAVNFIESLLILLALLVLSVILPSKWFYEQFVVKGSALTLLTLGGLMLFNQTLFEDILHPSILLPKLLAFAAVVVLLIFLFGRIGFLKKTMEELANRMTVFLYIWMPITAISVLVLLVRNIF